MNQAILPAIGLTLMSLTMVSLLKAEESVSATVNVEQSIPLKPIEGMMSDEQLKKQQEHLLRMHDLSTRILAARDSKEKQRLMDDQLNLMREHQGFHHRMMQQHMQEMMKNKAGMPMMHPSAHPETPEVTNITPK